MQHSRTRSSRSSRSIRGDSEPQLSNRFPAVDCQSFPNGTADFFIKAGAISPTLSFFLRRRILTDILSDILAEACSEIPTETDCSRTAHRRMAGALDFSKTSVLFQSPRSILEAGDRPVPEEGTEIMLLFPFPATATQTREETSRRWRRPLPPATSNRIYPLCPRHRFRSPFLTHSLVTKPTAQQIGIAVIESYTTHRRWRRWRLRVEGMNDPSIEYEAI